VPPDPGAIEVDVRISLCQLAHARDLIGERVVAHAAEVEIAERLRAPLRAHAVDGDDDEPQLGERLVVTARGEEGARADAAAPRPRVDVVDDGVLA
jgi:hypothetical protein